MGVLNVQEGGTRRLSTYCAEPPLAVLALRAAESSPAFVAPRQRERRGGRYNVAPPDPHA